MFALVPGKDALLFLAKIQKKCLSVFNSVFFGQVAACPVFPLWAFFDFPLPEKIVSCEFCEPVLKDEKFIFPVQLICLEGENEKTVKLEVVFGKILGNKKSGLQFHLASDEIESCFPHKIRIFKTGSVIVQNNSWQLFDEKWIKCRPVS